MSQPQLNTWQSIQSEVLRRIHAREWPPGHIIPNEVDLTKEFGCARATVNRALRELADSGVLQRRRKAGTRVALYPVSRATVDIPLIRQEIEQAAQDYSYRLLCLENGPPSDWADVLDAGSALHVTALHMANGRPYVFENRWINLVTVPQAAKESFRETSANEWLLANAPYTHGDISFFAAAASSEEAKILACSVATPLFVIERTTWDHSDAVTAVRLSYAPGHRIHTRIGT